MRYVYNNSAMVLMIKSLSGETRPKVKLKPAIAIKRDSTSSEPLDGPRRGRPSAEGSGQVISCRLPAEELHAFDALCTQLGAKSRSDGVRSIVRMAAGFLEFSREDSARLEEIRYELGKIGTNVNQIALAANRGRAPMVRAQWASVDELRRSLPSVAKTLNQIIAERRRQGVALFRKFAEAQGVRHG
ncbi:plasmid mobilization relaxosome protein MobC [Pseudorhodobacter wandonensis]|uniref:plasmid mobilization relaxosome protein MobC n=1 Tax=Pseudorhodobacter wandonensis TaxID=1120568 RepID=UPI000A5FB4B7|nr:plasmid mobilization relaxosome protein MobC [Pseudorhodobacter wandonensis]